MIKRILKLGIWNVVAGLTLMSLSVPAGAAQFEQPQRAAQQPQAAARANAVTKTGFFDGFDRGRVKLIEENSYRKLNYIIDDKAQILLHEQPIERNFLIIHSVVKLIVVDGVVVEIVVLQEPS